MKCPKCRYTSFPFLEKCPKCGLGLAEQRAAMGIYALPPDPPDLLLAYQAAMMDVTAGKPMHPASAPDMDLGQLEGIDLEMAEMEPHGVGTPEMEGPPDPASDLLSMRDRKAIEEEEFTPVEPSSERVSPQEIIIPQSLDLSGLGDIALAIENAADLAGESSESAQIPAESAEVKPVYDLDLDGELNGLTLESIVDGVRAGDADDEAGEYTLELEEDLELEFEVDGLDVEQDEEDADDDR
jgi:hypothetical protein